MKIKRFVSWDEIEKYIDVLAEKVRHELPNIDSIHGIPRGGLAPAAMLAYKLGLDYSNVMLPNTLVVDDICDSGKTIRDAVGVYSATIFTKNSAIVQPTISVVTLLNENQWIVFPWEREDSDMIQDYLK